MQIVLATLNARFSHAAFGLRYLRANLGSLKSESIIQEFTLQQDPSVIVHKILEQAPQIVGFGIYIWNTTQTLRVLKLLKEQAPHIWVVLGGPEISFETESQEHIQYADYVIQGEADFQFRDLCLKLLVQRPINQPLIEQQMAHDPKAGSKPAKILSPVLPEISQIHLPYAEYTDDDVAHRIIYVEASRGCPYKCEYCLSSLDKSVRNFNISLFLSEMQALIDRGVRQFKFVDRTFNLSPKISNQILSFFLERAHLGLFLHFEMVPDRLPEELRDLIQKFPEGSLQFEVGIQTLNTSVAFNVSRRQNYERIRENFEFLTQKTKVHLHTDLIVGLPGETIESFAKGFDEVRTLKSDEIQIGILKRLKGTPITQKEDTYQLKYESFAPFQVLSTRDMSGSEIAKMVKFSKVYDWYVNSGNFIRSRALLFEGEASAFSAFDKFVTFVELRIQQFHSVPLVRLFEIFLEYKPYSKEKLIADYLSIEGRTLPIFLRSENLRIIRAQNSRAPEGAAPKRQQKHRIVTS